jgi:hypothetical protein
MLKVTRATRANLREASSQGRNISSVSRVTRAFAPSLSASILLGSALVATLALACKDEDTTDVRNTAGSAGAGGSSGSGGSGGLGGGAGTAGSGGTAGTGGGGSSGSAGTGGSAGSAGTAGNAGSAGSGGTADEGDGGVVDGGDAAVVAETRTDWATAVCARFDELAPDCEAPDDCVNTLVGAWGAQGDCSTQNDAYVGCMAHEPLSSYACYNSAPSFKIDYTHGCTTQECAYYTCQGVPELCGP